MKEKKKRKRTEWEAGGGEMGGNRREEKTWGNERMTWDEEEALQFRVQ